MSQQDNFLAKLVPRLWSSSTALHTFTVLDGASNDGLLNVLYGDKRPKFECLFTGELAPDMAYVAPYLAELQEGSDFAHWAVEGGWGNHWGLFVLSQVELPELWRHLRALTKIFDPEGSPMYFRFYDPRVLRQFLPTCDVDQLQAIFGPVDKFILEGDTPDQGLVFSFQAGELVQEKFSL